MNLTPYQIVVPLLSTFMVAYAWNLAFRQKKTVWESLLWTLFWGAIALVAFYPRLLTYLSVVTGIQDQVNAVIMTSIGIIFFLVFYLILRMEELSKRQTDLVRHMALKDAGLEGGQQKNDGVRS